MYTELGLSKEDINGKVESWYDTVISRKEMIEKRDEKRKTRIKTTKAERRKIS